MNSTLKDLSAQKDVIEKEIGELRKQINVLDETEGYNKSLVDAEGFPREDLDFGKLQSYRLLKKRLNELQTDHVSLMKDVEKELHALHQHYDESGQAQKDIDEYESTIDKQKVEKKQKEIDDMNELLKQKSAQKAAVKAIPIPFCEITVVIDKSPAYEGGIRLEDMITNFGTISSANFTETNQLVEVVRNNIGREIPVKLLRETEEKTEDEENSSHQYKGKHYSLIEIKITPKQWEGEGVLGCRFATII